MKKFCVENDCRLTVWTCRAGDRKSVGRAASKKSPSAAQFQRLTRGATIVGRTHWYPEIVFTERLRPANWVITTLGLPA
ncbi:hypothetical protein Baya_4334 [Bagarius yarrelli]|uniref:Uncharacterized protein n=1 Tax=Bagarius yarrelli TaxID=175774 RepID=A0A556TPV8_BAGYA|nr:hypothetical protein Baya_4334 [Bagarius yarrelli]